MVLISDYGPNIIILTRSVFFSYFSQLAGSGQEMRELVRHSYHQLVLMLVTAVQGFSALNEKWVLSTLFLNTKLCALKVTNNKYAIQGTADAFLMKTSALVLIYNSFFSLCPSCLMSVISSLCL